MFENSPILPDLGSKLHPLRRTVFLRAAIVVMLAWASPVIGQQASANSPPEASQDGTKKAKKGATGKNAAGQGAGDAVASASEKDRLRFEVPFKDEAGGGSAVVFAEELRQSGDVYALVGNVEVRYRDIVVRADRAEIDRQTKWVQAMGEVVLDQGPTRLTAAQLEYDLENDTGRLLEARGYTASNYFFRGREIIKDGELHYTVIDGIFTSCDQENPSWSFRTGRTDVVLEGFAKAKHARIRIKSVPVFYWPYMMWPVRSERSSGLLVPKPGYSTRRGGTLGLTWFQTLGRSYDMTFYAEASSEDYWSFGNEFRYRPSETTAGVASGLIVNDPVEGDERWKMNWNHTSDALPFGMRGVIHVDQVSDFDFFQDFERRIDQNSRRQQVSTAYATGSWGRHSLNLLAEQRETILSTEAVVTLRQLPEAAYRLRSTQIGDLPIYVQAQGSINGFDVDRSADYRGSYGRADFFPQVRIPLKAFPWLSISADLSARYTYWSDSLRVPGDEEADGTSQFSGEALSRFLPIGSAAIVGPSFSRIFGVGNKTGTKYKHVVEPRLNYNFSGDFEDLDRVARFDEIDLVRSRNLGRVALVNRLLAKKGESQGGAREILNFELARSYSFDDTQPLQQSSDRLEKSQAGPLSVLFRYVPSRSTTFQTEWYYNTLFGGVESTSTSGSFAFGPHNVGLRWTTRNQVETGMTQTDQWRIATSFEIVPRALRLTSAVNFDGEAKYVPSQRHILDWKASCFGMRFEYAEFRNLSGTRNDREFRFALSLKNVGTFLDLTGGGAESL